MSTVLIIDDELALVDVLRTILEEAGYQVLSAHDGNVGMALLRSRPINLVLLDIFMAELDGFETLALISSEAPATKIIAMSGGGGRMDAPSVLEMALQFGADLALTKPFSIQELLESVNSLLAGKP